MTHLSAVIVNFRTPEATIAAVQSLEASSRPPQDIIVVENGSGDDSAERLRAAVPDVAVLVATENGGFAAGANLGIRYALRAGAGLVLLVNSDAVLDRRAIETLEAGLAATDGAGIAGPTVLQVTDPPRIESTALAFSPRTGRVWMQRFGERFDSQAVTRVEVVPAITGCVMLIAADVFERIGLLPEDYFWGFEDLDFCLAAARAGWKTVTVGDAIAHHQGSLSIGRRSPDRIRWATRNHLLLLQRRAPMPVAFSALRACLVVLYNAAYALTAPGMPRVAGIKAVVQGAQSYRAADHR